MKSADFRAATAIAGLVMAGVKTWDGVPVKEITLEEACRIYGRMRRARESGRPFLPDRPVSFT